MDVICYGLSLPLTSDHETIKDSVNVYCEWLTALHPVPKISVPAPICADPNLYARRMINHLHNLFIPRPGEGEFPYFNGSSSILSLSLPVECPKSVSS